MRLERAKKALQTKYAGPVIGLVVFGLLLLISHYTVVFKNLGFKILDTNFRLKTAVRSQRIQEGVTVRR